MARGPPGQGQLPPAESVDLLRGADLAGRALFEHEKRWHQELEAPETVFPKYVAWLRPLLQRPTPSLAR